MAIDIMLPKKGWSTEEAIFVEWLKADGDEVKAGEPLFSVETDKAVLETESMDDGILRILPGGPTKNDVVKVGQVIGHLLAPGEKAAAAAAPAEDAVEAPTVPAVAIPTGVPKAETPVPAAPAVEGRAVTPRAAKRAMREGVDLRTVRGSGRDGRIRECDVSAERSGVPDVVPASGPPGHEVPITPLRRTIAERMVRGKTLTAAVTLTTKADAGNLVKLRARYKAAADASDDPVPSYGDMVMKLVAAALKQHPALNARWEESRIVRVEPINIGVAVDTEAGLLVPVVRDVPALSLRQLTSRTSDLITRARQRRVAVEELKGGTFTVSNLGAANVDAFTPIINHPECAVLGIGRIGREPAVAGERVVVRDAVWLSLTFDHRVVDGAPAARFLDTVRKLVESPEATLTA